MEIELVIPNLDTFYNECENVESTGNKQAHREHTTEKRSDFCGLSNADIVKSKYYYPIEGLKDLSDEIVLSGSKTIKKYDDVDGEDMNMDRYTESLPYLEKTIRHHGDRQGKFINLYVNVCEPWMINHKNMAHKARTAIEICDLLESQGYKVNVYNRIEISRLGRFKGNELHYVAANILIKSSDEPLIKPLVYTTISPWFFRYWWFRFLSAKFNTYSGMGCPAEEFPKSTRSDVYINTGECLNEDGVSKKLAEIKTLFDLNNEDEE